MQQRRGTASQWTTGNPVLAPGEIGFETDTGKFKIGDGVKTWTALVYYASATELAAIVDGAPDLLNTLNELAAAIGDDANFAASVTTHVSATEAHGATGAVVGTTNSQTLTNKTISGSANTLSNIAQSSVTNLITDLSALDGRLDVVEVDLGTLDTNVTSLLEDVATANENILNLQTDKAPINSPTFTGTLTSADLVVTGDLTVSGTTTTVSTQDLLVTDPLIYVGEGNSTNLVDLGIVSSFNDGTYQHTGLVRDASDGKWKLFKGVTDEPTTTVNFTQGSLDDIAVGGLNALSITLGGADVATESYVDTAVSGAAVDQSTLAGTGIDWTGTQFAVDTEAIFASPTFTGSVNFTGATVTGIDSLPSQSGNSGKYLTTNGTTASWATVSGGSSSAPTIHTVFAMA